MYQIITLHWASLIIVKTVDHYYFTNLHILASGNLKSDFPHTVHPPLLPSGYKHYSSQNKVGTYNLVCGNYSVYSYRTLLK